MNNPKENLIINDFIINRGLLIMILFFVSIKFFLGKYKIKEIINFL